MTVRRLLLLAILALAVAPLMALPLLARPASAGDCPTVATVEGLDSEQLANAKVIVAVARRMGLDERAATVGVMTALAESSLRNVAHGDAAGPDSRGLFQQRDGWGPVEVRMDPAGAAGQFYGALVATPGWVRMQPWSAAQAVQRSAFSDGRNYAGSYEIARRIAATLGELPSAALGCAAGFTRDAYDETLLPGASAAVERAWSMVGQRGYYQLCARLAARVWGRQQSGFASAADQWTAMVASGNAHPGDPRPPVGALLFWDTGGTYGHVAVYIGRGQIVSNDIGDDVPGEGGVYVVDVVSIQSEWGARYLGWSPPLYGRADPSGGQPGRRSRLRSQRRRSCSTAVPVHRRWQGQTFIHRTRGSCRGSAARWQPQCRTHDRRA